MVIKDLLKGIGKLRLSLAQLPPRDQKIFMYRWGFYFRFMERPKTLEETGKRFKMGRERVRQIEAKAFEKIREDLD